MASLKSSFYIIVLFILSIQFTKTLAGRKGKGHADTTTSRPPPKPLLIVETTLIKPNDSELNSNSCSIYDADKIIVALKKCVSLYKIYSIGQDAHDALNSSKTNFDQENGTNGNETDFSVHNMLSFIGMTNTSPPLYERISKIPCFGACIMLDLGYISTNGTANHTFVTEKLTKIHSIKNTNSSKKIVQNCYSKTGYNGTRMIPDNKNKIFNFTDWDSKKCQLISKFGICLASSVSDLCKTKKKTI